MDAYSCPSLECAPCPPFFVVDIYQILVNVAISQNLSESEYKTIALRCNIPEPTTTSTTTTTAPTTASTTTFRTNRRTSSTTSSTSGHFTSNITEPIIFPGEGNNTIFPTAQSSLDGTTNIPSSTKDKPSTSTEMNTTSTFSSSTSLPSGVSGVTGMQTTPKMKDLSTGGSAGKRRWPYCNDVCLIIVITSSICAFLIVLVTLALCCRKDRPLPKSDSRSNSSQRLVTNGTYDRTSSLDRHQLGLWQHNPGIENLAYRKSMEVRAPLKYMDYEQNWGDLDYYDAGTSSLKSNKSSSRNENSPRRKRRPNKEGKQNSEGSCNQRAGAVFIPLEDRKPRSLPRIPTDPGSYHQKPEVGYPNGVGFLSLPRNTTNSRHKHGVEHRRSKSDSHTRPSRTKQRPRSFEQLYRPAYYDVAKRDGAISNIKNTQVTLDSKYLKDNMKTKDIDFKHTNDTKVNNSNQKGVNRSLERDKRTRDSIFENLQGSSSPKFYPPYRDSNNHNLLYTTKL